MASRLLGGVLRVTHCSRAEPGSSSRANMLARQSERTREGISIVVLDPEKSLSPVVATILALLPGVGRVTETGCVAECARTLTDAAALGGPAPLALLVASRPDSGSAARAVAALKCASPRSRVVLVADVAGAEAAATAAAAAGAGVDQVLGQSLTPSQLVCDVYRGLGGDGALRAPFPPPDVMPLITASMPIIRPQQLLHQGQQPPQRAAAPFGDCPGSGSRRPLGGSRGEASFAPTMRAAGVKRRPTAPLPKQQEPLWSPSIDAATRRTRTRAATSQTQTRAAAVEEGTARGEAGALHGTAALFSFDAVAPAAPRVADAHGAHATPAAVRRHEHTALAAGRVSVSSCEAMEAGALFAEAWELLSSGYSPVGVLSK